MSTIRFNTSAPLGSVGFVQSVHAGATRRRDPSLEVRIDNARLMPRVAAAGWQTDWVSRWGEAVPDRSGPLGALLQRFRAARDLDDPELTGNAVSYSRVEGELWGTAGPQLADVDQGRSQIATSWQRLVRWSRAVQGRFKT